MASKLSFSLLAALMLGCSAQDDLSDPDVDPSFDEEEVVLGQLDQRITVQFSGSGAATCSLYQGYTLPPRGACDSGLSSAPPSPSVVPPRPSCGTFTFFMCSNNAPERTQLGILANTLRANLSPTYDFQVRP